VDPFASTADAASYLPREATESALARLAEGFRQGRRVQVLSGPPGVGKTLLLHVLAARLEREFRSLYLPYASLSWLDFCAFVLGLLGEPPGPFPDRELLASARRFALHGRPLLLLLDEASGIPLESAERLGELVHEAEGSLRLLLVPVDEARAGRVLAILARDVEELRLSAPLTLEETERYLRTRLVRFGVPLDDLRRFDADTVAHLHRASGGNPRRLQHLAGEVMRGNTAALPGSEARAALDAVPGESDTLEVDAAAAAAGATGAGRGDDVDAAVERDAELPSLRGSAAGAATPSPWRPAGIPPAPSVAASPRAEPGTAKPGDAAMPQPAYEPPLGPREPERTNWWLVVAVNLALLAGTLAGLWVGGLVPPPAHP
jgi:type II secretory pathway predicted ATPase ExeA